jgi:hypothetical protein
MTVGADWGFVVPGQPVSWNQGYEIGRVARTGGGGRLRLGSDGRPIEARTIVKTGLAKAYTEEVVLRARAAAPRGWWDGGLVVIELYYFLGRDIDCDNVMKFVDDGIETATGVNDRWFLTRAMWKTTGLRPKDRRLVVRVRSESASLRPADSLAYLKPSTSS